MDSDSQAGAGASGAREHVQKGLWELSGHRPEAPAGRSVAADLRTVLGLALPLRRNVAVFVGLHVLAAVLLLAALACFHTGFLAMTGGLPEAETHPATRLAAALGIAPDRLWLPLFTAFAGLSVLAAWLDHRAWVVRLQLMSAYEARQMVRALKVISALDPRVRAGVSRREMLLAARGDCKAMRLVFQLVLLSAVSLVQAVGPIGYALTLDPVLTGAALALLAASFLPIQLLARRSAGMSLKRQSLGMALGARVSELIKVLQRQQLSKQQRNDVVVGMRDAMEDQHQLWREQYEIRSLSQKVPQVAALLATFGIVLWGVARIDAGLLSWGDLLTLVIASRMIFGPFSGLGNRFAKTAEQIPRARRHLAFMASYGGAEDAAGVELVPRTAPVLAARELVLTPDGEPLDFTVEAGGVLTLIDPVIDLQNPLYRAIVGERFAESGVLTVNDQPVESLAHDSLSTAIASHAESPGRMQGTLLDCLREIAGERVEREELEAFAHACLGPLHGSLQKGLDTFVSLELKKERRVPRSAWRLLQLYQLHRKPKQLVLADYSTPLHPHCAAMIRRYTEHYRHGVVTLWLDRAPRLALAEQTLVVFERGQQRGSGDLAWFRQRFSHWDDLEASDRPRDVEDEAVASLQGREIADAH